MGVQITVIIYENAIPREITTEEIAEMKDYEARIKAEERHRSMTSEEVIALLIRKHINTLEVDGTTALRMTEFYPEWAAGQAYTAGYKVQYGGKLWRCLQAHTSQDGWEPDSATSLWAKVLITDENVVPEWEQPDSTNPYSAGDKVTHNGKTWVSTIDNNVWEPGTVEYWKEV